MFFLNLIASDNTDIYWTSPQEGTLTLSINTGLSMSDVYLAVTLINNLHLVGLQEHVDHPRRSVAPVHQQVPVVPDAGRVVPWGEPEPADVVDAGLHQPVHVLGGGHEARLRGPD